MRTRVAGGAASESRPLSGPTRSASRVSTQIGRRGPPDARVDDRDVDAAVREEGQGVPEDEGSGADVLRRDAVGHVDHRNARRTRGDHALHDADEGIGEYRSRW